MLTATAERAVDAPVIRQLFSSSPKDPRYHMLSYISHKFSQKIKPQPHEPRAALFLNRFTRTLTIVYATNGLADLLGISADELCGKSFYYCIQENCLKDAVKCLESAKANDSIAYLRFWFRDPRQEEIQDEHMDGNSSGEDEEGGVHLDERMDEAVSEHAVTSESSASQSGSLMDHNITERSSAEQASRLLLPHDAIDPNSRSSSGNSSDLHGGANEEIFDQPATRQSSTSSLDVSPSDDHRQFPARTRSPGPVQIELEAVVSCTSDGLVVVLRRARALVPRTAQPAGAPVRRSYENGFFASPWATDTLLPNIEQRRYDQPDHYQPGLTPVRPTVAQADTAAMKGPDQEDFMNSIREVAVFAWSLTGINGSLARYGRGKPRGESLPPDGLPIWRPDSQTLAEQERHPYHGNNPQETRRHGRPYEPADPSRNGHRIPSDQADDFNGYPHDRSNSMYGSEERNVSSEESNEQYSNGHHQTSYTTSSNETHDFSQSSYSNGLPNGFHVAQDNPSNDEWSRGSNGYGNHRPWNGGNPGYNNTKPDQQQYGHDNMDTRESSPYFHDEYNKYHSNMSNGATYEDGPSWLSQPQQTQHWDGLMPNSTSSHGNSSYRSPSSYQ